MKISDISWVDAQNIDSKWIKSEMACGNKYPTKISKVA